MKQSITKKINAYFIICLLLFSMFPIQIPIASASVFEYNEDRYTVVFPDETNSGDKFEFNSDDEDISWTINSLLIDNGEWHKIDKVSRNELIYENSFQNSGADIRFELSKTALKQIIEIDKSELPNDYNTFAIFETYTTSKNSNNWYIDYNTSERLFSTKETGKEILAKELYFGDNRLHLKEPKAWDSTGTTITGYYDIKYNSPSSINLKTTFKKIDIDTLSETIYFDPTIENGFTGYTQYILNNQSGNWITEFDEVEISSVIANITNYNPSSYSINGIEWINKLTYYQNVSKTQAGAQTELNQTNFNITSDIFDNIMTDGNGDPIINITYINGTNIPFYSAIWNSVSDFSLLTKSDYTIGNNTRNLYYFNNSDLTSASNEESVYDILEDFSTNDGTFTLHNVSASYAIAQIIGGQVSIHRTVDWGTIGASAATSQTFQKDSSLKIQFSWKRNHVTTTYGNYVTGMKMHLTSYAENVTRVQLSTDKVGSTAFDPINNNSLIWTVPNTSINTYFTQNVRLDGNGNYKVDNGAWDTAPNWADLLTTYNIDFKGAGCGGAGNNDYIYYDNIEITRYLEPDTILGSITQAAGPSNFTLLTTPLVNITESIGTGNLSSLSIGSSITSNISINTDSIDWGSIMTKYWQEDITLIEETTPSGYVKQFINYTPSANITSAVLNSTILDDLSSYDSVGIATSTLNGTSKTTTRILQEINASVGSLKEDIEYLWNITIPVNTNMTASVNDQTFSTTQDVLIIFTASDADSNPLIISGILNDSTKTTVSPHNYGPLPAGIYTYYLNITEDATVNPHSENLTATITVTQNYGSVPSIHDGVYGYHYDTIPSESQILTRQTDGLVTVDIPIDFDIINASTWTTILSRISYAYDENIRISLHLNMNGTYTSQSYIDEIKSNVSIYLSDLIDNPYQTNTQFLTLNFTNTSAIESEKVSFANEIGVNISDSTNSKFNLITREQLTGLDTTYIDSTPIKYINLTTKSQWIDDEALKYRNFTTKSRIYTGNTSFFNDITTYRSTQLMKARGTSDVGNQYSEISSVKLTNGDILLYNNDSSSQNVSIQNVENGTYFNIDTDVYFNLSSNGTIYFTLSAESISYILKNTFDKIVFEDNSTSELKAVEITGDNIIDYGNTLNSSPLDSWMWGGANTDLKFEFYDPYYTKDNTFMIHYEWLNTSVVTDYTPYDYIIIADQNGNEINNSFITTTNLYGYVAVSGYADNDAWYNSKIAEIDTWIDIYDTNIFLDGIDFAVGGTNFSSRFKDLVEYIRVTKDKEAIINTYTTYEEFATYGNMVMKESTFSRWDGAVGNPTYSWENMTIEKERADYYTSHNIPVLGMSFGAVDDYEKQAFDSFAFAVLYGFDGENSWRYGQPNFQSQVELSMYPFGTMLEDTYTEHSPTDWSRLYEAGRVHINPIDHTYFVDNDLHVNSIKLNMSLYSGAEGSGDRNVYVYVNDNTTPYVIPYNAGVDPVGVWQDKQIELSPSEYNTTGHYNIYAYTLRSASGGWNTIGKQNITGIGTHTWLDSTIENIPTTFINQTWQDIDMTNPIAIEEDSNWMVSFSTNVTTSIVLDDIENIISQSNLNSTYNATTIIESTKDYDIPFWSGVTTITGTFANASAYFKAQNGTWVEASVNTVTDITSNAINWAYTTIDGKVYGVVKQVVSTTEFIYRFLFPEVSTSEEVYVEKLPTIQNLVSTPDLNHIHFNWDDYNGADYFNVSQMTPNVYITNDIIILDGIKDAAFTNDAHTWIGDSPNPSTEYGQESISWVRNATTLSGYADGEDLDAFTHDDTFELMLDFNNDNLTVGDLKYILNEGGTVTAQDWTGSAWNPNPTDAVGIVIGAGGNGAIQYEMQIPISELTNFTNGNTFKFAMSRTHTGSNPDVYSYYPQTLINDTDATLWDEMTLTNETQYEFIGNTTTSDYQSENLNIFTWYKHKITAINGIDESIPVYSIDTTLDNPSYTISGYVKDIFGNILANVEMWAQNGFVSEVDISDEFGFYSGTHFHNGSYDIYGNLTGYIINWTSVVVAGANLTNVNVTLDYSQYFPPTPINLTYSTYNFGINYSFVEGLNFNNTDSYNITFNGTEYNGITDLFFNKSVGPHGYGNITIYAYNNTNDGALSTGFLISNITIPNNNITITNGSSSTINEGEIVHVNFDYIDLDLDTPTFSTNRSDLFTNFNTTTGIGSWITNSSNSGIYFVDFGVSDGYNSISNYTMSITVIDSVEEEEEETVTTGGGSSGISDKGSTGGIGVSGEEFDNILHTESSIIYYAQYNNTVRVTFDNSNLHDIKSITYIPTKNAQNVGVMIEKLKSKSIYAKTFPPHILYSNVNIWVGSLDYSNNLKDAQIEFTVPKEWIVKNAVTKISLMHYNINTDKWEKLPTEMTKVSFEKYTYTATTQSFSPFAIVGESISTPSLLPLSEKIINILPENIQDPINEIIEDNEKISSSITNADSNLNLMNARIKSILSNNNEIIMSFIIIIIISLLFTILTAINSTLIHILLTIALMGLIYLLTQDFYPLEHYITENISSELLNKIRYTRGLLSTLMYLLVTIIPAQYIKEKINK